jgi:hypothetical protein
MSRDSHKQNVTICLSKATLRKAKVLAARWDTSISGLLAQQIEILVSKEEAYKRAERRAIQLLDHGFRLGGLVPANRDEMHKR